MAGTRASPLTSFSMKNKATESGPESPTTARPFDLDDDDVQESGILGSDDGNTTTAAATNTSQIPAQAQAPKNETAPPKPPRPMSEAQKNEGILKEAFPGVELSVIKAVLRASGGRVEPAFNALLGRLTQVYTKETSLTCA